MKSTFSSSASKHMAHGARLEDHCEHQNGHVCVLLQLGRCTHNGDYLDCGIYQQAHNPTTLERKGYVSHGETGRKPQLSAMAKASRSDEPTSAPSLYHPITYRTGLARFYGRYGHNWQIAVRRCGS